MKLTRTQTNNKVDMKSRNIITAFFIFVSTLLNAQSHNEQVTVEGSFTPHIKKSERILIKPTLPKHEFDIPRYDVSTEDFFYNYKVELEPMSPAQYINTDIQETTSNFIKAGIGTRLSPDFLFRHYSNISRNMSLGIGVTHNSTWLEMKDYPNSKYMNNDFSVSLNNRFSSFQLHSYINYDYDMYNLCYTPEVTTDDAPYTKRNIHSLNVKLLANNNETAYKSIYNEYMLDYSYSGIQGGIQENLAKFKAHIEHSNSWFRNGNGIQTLSLDINADIDNILSNGSQTSFLIVANPYLAFDGDYYSLHLGFRIDAKTNYLGGFYPDLKGSLYLFERQLEFYAGLDGMTKINTLKNILKDNPFIVTDLIGFSEFDYEKTKLDFRGGVKFKALNKLSGHAGLSYKTVNNHVFYIRNADKLNTFDIILNDCNIFNFNIDLHYRLKDDIKLAANFSYNKYNMIQAKSPDSLINALEDIVNQEAWYKPQFEFTLRGTYKYNDNWNFNAATYFEGKRYDLFNYEKVNVLKPFCDIQLGCDFNYNDNLAFYAEIKNLIHNKYQIYYNYPSYGFQTFVGFKYRF